MLQDRKLLPVADMRSDFLKYTRQTDLRSAVRGTRTQRKSAVYRQEKWLRCIPESVHFQSQLSKKGLNGKKRKILGNVCFYFTCPKIFDLHSSSGFFFHFQALCDKNQKFVVKRSQTQKHRPARSEDHTNRAP